MNVQSELGYSYPKDSLVQRWVQAVAVTAAGAWVFRKVAYRFDRLILRWSAGRTTLTAIVAGKPVLMLTTRGAKSGIERTVPLLGIPVGQHLLIIGSNFGQRPTPGWVHNLLADPKARVAYRDRAVDVVARIATGGLVEAAFEAGAKLYPGFAKYRERVAHREIKVFVLEFAV